MHYYQIPFFSAIKTIPLVLGIVIMANASAFSAIINVPADHATISLAVAAANPGDEIVVAPGTYNENVTVNKSLIIRSSGGRAATTVNGSDVSGVLGTFLITADNVTIGGPDQGFTINGYDNASPGIEYAAIYIQGVRSNITIRGNDVVANGEGGLLSEFGNAVNNLTVDANIFSGKTFVGAQAGDCGFANQFVNANVPRQLVVVATGSGIVFTSNQITGTAGSTSAVSGCTTFGQGNTLVTIDANNATIARNNFAGTTFRFGSSLRIRGTGVSVSCNTFNNAGLALSCTHITFNATSIANLAAPNTVAGIAGANTFVGGGAYLNPLNTSVNIFRDNAQATAVASGGQVAINANAAALASVSNVNTGINYCSIQDAINDANTLNGHTISVAAGTYNEDVTVSKSLTISGAGCGVSTVIGPIGGPGATFSVSATGVTIEGFTITRAGNNTSDWNNAGLNSAGISVAASGVATIRNNCIEGNRTGIDINNSSGNVIQNNRINNNRTGMIFRNTTNNTTVTGNFITNNWTLGVLFLDASGGTNIPVQSALNSNFNNNDISGNWYGQIVDRQSGGSLPTPGTTNLKNFTCNWYGVLDPVVSTNNSAEPGYAALIPVIFGGAATPPGGQPDILGTASANLVFQPFLNTGTDNDLGTFGFQAVPGSCVACAIQFTTCPTPIVTTTEINTCKAKVDYNVVATGVPTPTLSYQFTGATNMSGLGSGSGSNFTKGLTTVVITATTPCGSETCSFTVQVNDEQKPTIQCPNDIVRPNDPGKCGATVTYTTPFTDDNCEVFSVVLINNSLPSNSFFPVGTTNVEWRVTDQSGNSTRCFFKVTINDVQLPTIICPTPINKWTTPGTCDAVILFALKGLSDNCGGNITSSYSVAPNNALLSGQAWPIGTYTVTYTAKDVAQNPTNCSFTVKVSDGQAPSISCPQNQTKNTDANFCTAAITYAPVVTDNCSGATWTAVTPSHSSGSPFNKGVTTVVLRATDAAGLTKTCTFRVTVNDRQAPVISCAPNQSVNTGAGQCSAVVDFNNATFTDNCTPTGPAVRISGPAPNTAFPKGTTNVVYRATDASGNFALCTVKIKVTDNEKPKITCPMGPINRNTDAGKCNAVVSYSTPTSTDNCAGVQQQLLSGLASGSVFPVGSTTVRWQAKDAVGLTETCQFTVTVTDNQAPTITCPPNTTIMGGSGACTIPKAQLPSATAQDNCSVTSLSSNAPATVPAGTITVIWTALDAANQQTPCQHNVTVMCQTGPNVGGGNLLDLTTADGLGLGLAPNPASESVLVAVSGIGEAGAELGVYDALGRMVWRLTLSSGTEHIKIDLVDGVFADGHYQVSLRTDSAVITKSLVVTKK